MGASNPLHPALMLLWLALPFVWLCGRELMRRLRGDDRTAAACAPAVGIGAWLLAVHVSGLWLRSFSAALVCGSVVCGALGVGLLIRRPRAPAADAERDSRVAWIWIAISAALAVAIMAPAALDTAMHDERRTVGHMSIAAQLQNDVYPPLHLVFPAFELRYHYGFDVLTAFATALTRTNLAVAIDAVTLVLWGYAWWLCWVLGERLHGRGAGFVTAALVLFGGGANALCTDPTLALPNRLTHLCLVDGWWVNTPMTSYFFQHPWSLGLPLAIAALLVSADEKAADTPRLVVLGLILVALSLSQIVLFLCVTGALALREAFRENDRRRLWRVPRRWVLAALFAMAALSTSSTLGGFFAPGPSGERLVEFHVPITETWAGSARWVVYAFGALLPLGVAGVFAIRRERLTYVTLALGSFGCLLLFRAPNSWNMAKFGVVTSIACAVMIAALIVRLCRVRRPLAYVAAALMCGVCVAQGVAFLSVLAINSVKRDKYKTQIEGQAIEPDGAHRDAIVWVRAHAARGEVVYVGKRWLAAIYASWGGFAVGGPWNDGGASAFGFRELLDRRIALFARSPPDPAPYLALGFRWFVIDSRDRHDRKLFALTSRWVAEGRAKRRANFGSLHIVELLRGSS